MQRLSARKLSILGLVLLAASAITAAVSPSKKTTSSECEEAGNGRLILSTGFDIDGVGLTCERTFFPPIFDYCHYTETINDSPFGSSTTGPGEGESDSITNDEGNYTGTGTTCDFFNS